MSVAGRVESRRGHSPLWEKVRVGVGMWRVEFRRSVCLWLSPFLAAALAWTVYEGLPAGIWLWPDTVYSVQYSLILYGPLVGGLSAWTASRERRRGMGDLLFTTPRPAPERDLAVWAATATWCTLAYAVVASAFLFLTYLGATWGAPEPGPLLTGLVAVVAHSALGFAAGRYLPSRFTPPLFAIAMYWIQGLTLFGLASSLAYLSPLDGDVAPTVFYDETPDILLSRIAWLLGLVGISLSAAALKRERNPRSWAVLVVAATVAILGVAGISQAPSNTINARGTPIPYEPVCREGNVNICVHPAFETALPETVRVVDDFTAPLAGVPGAPVRAEQRPEDARVRPDGTLVFSLYGPFIRWNVNNGYTFRDYMESELATALIAGPSGFIEYPSGDGNPCRGPGGPPGEAQRVISAWLTFRSGDYASADSMAFMEATDFRLCPESTAAVERFDALTPAKRRAWLEKNFADLRAGKLTLADLP